MRAPRPPGVVFNPQDPRPNVVQRVRTDIAGFVGIAQRGPLHTPHKVESWNQFTTLFGGHVPQGHLAYAVEGFFANAGQTCWIVRVADPDAAHKACGEVADSRGRPALRLTARDPGTGGNSIAYVAVRTARERFSLTLSIQGQIREVWHSLSMWPEDPHYAPRVINESPRQSRLARVEDISPPSAFFPDSTPETAAASVLAGGTDGLSTLEPVHFDGEGAPQDATWGLKTLEKIDDVAILCMPDMMPKERFVPRHAPRPRPCDPPYREGSERTTAEFPPDFSEEDIARLQQSMIRQCETLKDRFAILDLPPALIGGAVDVERWIDWRRRFRTRYAALYGPWLRVRDPIPGQVLRMIPPSGHLAGLYARVDRRRGVHKPPAGERLEQVQDLSRALDDDRHARLNEAQVNVVRALPGRGIQALGARTLADPNDEPEWRFVNVRRLVTMVEEAIEEGTHWTTFLGNAPGLWIEIDRVVRTFLDRLWQQGMLDGATPDEAFFVKCDEATNPETQVDAGQAVCRVGLRPPWPAEFIEVRIGRNEDGRVELIERRGADGDA